MPAPRIQPESHTSPDGLITLTVEQLDQYDDAQDILVGFEQGPWHVHADYLLEWTYAHIDPPLSPEHAVRRYVDEILADQHPLVLFYKDDEFVDVQMFDHDESVESHAQRWLDLAVERPPPEGVRFNKVIYRLWSGKILRTLTLD